MEVKITCDPQIDNPEKVVFEELKKTCILGLNHFKIEVVDSNLRYEQ